MSTSGQAEPLTQGDENKATERAAHVRYGSEAAHSCRPRTDTGVS